MHRLFARRDVMINTLTIGIIRNYVYLLLIWQYATECYTMASDLICFFVCVNVVFFKTQ